MQKFGVSDKFLNCSNAALSHNFAKLLGNKHHKVYYIFRFAFESLSQLRVLSCNTYRTGIKIAYAHHNTAHCYKRSCGKAEFFCSKHAGDCDVTTAHKLSVSFYYNPWTKTIFNKSLMRFSKAKLPRQAGTVNWAFGSGSSTSVISRNKYYLSTRLCNACCYGAYAWFWNKLNGYSCITVSVLKVIYKLGEVLNWIYIMVRGRGYKRYAGCGVSCFCYPGIYLFAWKMSAFTRLCALSHFYLNFLCAYKIFTCYAKTSGGYLLNSTAIIWMQPFGKFSSFTGIWFSADCVHGLSQTFMCLLGYRTVAHCSRLKPFYNFGRRFYFINRYTLSRVIIEFKYTSKSMRFCLIIDHSGIFLEFWVIAGTCCFLKSDYSFRIVQMVILIRSAP